jgi:hypothetical protein
MRHSEVGNREWTGYARVNIQRGAWMRSEIPVVSRPDIGWSIDPTKMTYDLRRLCLC